MEMSVREKPIGLQDRIIISPIVMTPKCIHTILSVFCDSENGPRYRKNVGLQNWKKRTRAPGFSGALVR